MKVSRSSDEYVAMVLLVDDQMMVGEAVRRMLAGEPNIDFHFCSDPNEAIAVAREVQPTVILQDLVMPDVDGLDLVRKYRLDPATTSIPIIVLSTKEEATIKREAFTAGANDYLVKLPDPMELVARIRYHSRAHLNQVQRDEAYRALRESQQQIRRQLQFGAALQIEGHRFRQAEIIVTDLLAVMSYFRVADYRTENRWFPYAVSTALRSNCRLWVSKTQERRKPQKQHLRLRRGTGLK